MLEFPLPEKFISRIQNDEKFGQITLDAFDQKPLTSVRLNLKKSTELDFDLGNKVSWIHNGYYLDQRPLFTLSPLFHMGCFYPQEAASMVIGQIVQSLDLPMNPVILDACAAPGGKSTVLLDIMDGKGVLIANEMNKHRSNVLAENCSKWGYDNVIVTQNETKYFSKLPSFFDLVLLDAPCSGEGMFRKDLNSRLEWSEANIEMCANRQKEIIENVIDTIKPGGYLLYSTCTLNSTENEEIVSSIIENHAFELQNLTIENTIKGNEGIGNYFAPGCSPSEGLFVALLKKKQENLSTARNKKTSQNINLKVDKPIEIQLKENQMIFGFEKEIFAMSPFTFEIYNRLPHSLRIVKKGVALGYFAQKGFVPSHELAISHTIDNFYPRYEVNLLQARLFLHGDTFPINDAAIGFVCLTYKEKSLGFIKNMGNRFNNLYPKEWRIKMEIPLINE